MGAGVMPPTGASRKTSPMSSAGGARQSVLRVAWARLPREPVRMHDDVVDRRVRSVAFRIERDPQVGGAEPVLPLLDQEVRAVGGREDDVRADQRPRAEVEPVVAAEVDLQDADVRVPVRRVARAAHNKCWIFGRRRGRVRPGGISACREQGGSDERKGPANRESAVVFKHDLLLESEALLKPLRGLGRTLRCARSRGHNHKTSSHQFGSSAVVGSFVAASGDTVWRRGGERGPVALRPRLSPGVPLSWDGEG